MSTTGWVVLGVIAVVVIWAISVYNSLVAGLPQKVKPVPIGIRQIWNQKFDRVDRCITCHPGLKEEALADAPSVAPTSAIVNSAMSAKSPFFFILSHPLLVVPPAGASLLRKDPLDQIPAGPRGDLLPDVLAIGTEGQRGGDLEVGRVQLGAAQGAGFDQ